MKKFVFALFVMLLMAQVPLSVLAAEYSPRHCHGGRYDDCRGDGNYYRDGYGHRGYRR